MASVSKLLDDILLESSSWDPVPGTSAGRLRTDEKSLRLAGTFPDLCEALESRARI